FCANPMAAAEAERVAEALADAVAEPDAAPAAPEPDEEAAAVLEDAAELEVVEEAEASEALRWPQVTARQALWPERSECAATHWSFDFRQM
ncbi:hypothetical protein LTR28_000663, partial [Elasticomyces elasticus]